MVDDEREGLSPTLMAFKAQLPITSTAAGRKSHENSECGPSILECSIFVLDATRTVLVSEEESVTVHASVNVVAGVP